MTPKEADEFLDAEEGKSSIGHVPEEDKWEFDETVVGCFDDMLRRSIPQYDVMRAAVTDLASRFVAAGTDVVDLGCSKGDAMAPLIDKFGAHNRFIGLEVSKPMLAAAQHRFDGLIKCGVVDVRDFDLRTGFPPVRASVVLAVLSIQFTPIDHRQRIIRDVYEHLVPGGAFLLVEKVLAASSAIQKTFVDVYHGMKRDRGYSADEIERKRLSLEGVLVPVTARWNEEMLRSAGFTEVDCFWRWMNFCGWIATKR